MIDEYADLIGVLEMLGVPLAAVPSAKIGAKREKVERFLGYSAECGTLQA